MSVNTKVTVPVGRSRIPTMIPNGVRSGRDAYEAASLASFGVNNDAIYACRPPVSSGATPRCDHGGVSSSIALVTGATGGIGVHIARQFAEQGWTVLVGARDAAQGGEVAAEFGGRPRCSTSPTPTRSRRRPRACRPRRPGQQRGHLARHRHADHRDRGRGLPAYLRDQRVRRGRSHQRVLAGAAPLRASARRQRLQRHRIADLEHRPQSAVRLPRLPARGRAPPTAPPRPLSTR